MSVTVAILEGLMNKVNFFRPPILVIYVVDETDFNENNALENLARKKRSLIPMPEET